jgi:hypothetical protein
MLLFVAQGALALSASGPGAFAFAGAPPFALQGWDALLLRYRRREPLSHSAKGMFELLKPGSASSSDNGLPTD